MELKKHWPAITVGVAAVALGVYLYVSNRQKEHATLQDIEAAISAIDAKTWPSIRRVVDIELVGTKEAQTQLNEWLEKVMKEFINKRGALQTNTQGHLSEEDFLRIYEIIESTTRVHLYVLRKENEEKRSSLFQKAFFDEVTDAARKEARSQYVDALLQAIETECDQYRPSQDQVLKIAKVNQTIWEASMEEYLPVGDEFINKAFKVCLSSPFTFAGNQSKE